MYISILKSCKIHCQSYQSGLRIGTWTVKLLCSTPIKFNTFDRKYLFGRLYSAVFTCQ